MAKQKKLPAPVMSPLAIAVTVILFAGLFFFQWYALNGVRIFCVSSVDSFWLIQAGRDILTQGRIPTGDIYSYTNFGRTWIVYQWLFEVFSALLERMDGLQGIQAFVAFVCMLTFPVLALQGMLRSGVNFWLALLVSELAAAASFTFITLRPHMVSLLFVYLLKQILDSHWSKPTRASLLAVPLMLVWANVHLMFSVGNSMLVVYWLSSLVMWVRNRQSPEIALHYRQVFRSLGILLALCLGATLINPYGWQIYSYGWTTGSSGFWKGTIGEAMAPMFDDPIGRLIAEYIIFSIGALMIAGKRPSLPDGFMYLLLLLAGLTSWKMLPYFVTGTMHLTAVRAQIGLSQVVTERFPSFLKEITWGLGRFARTPYYALLCLGMAITFGLTQKVLFPPWVPQEAAEFLETHPVPARIFSAAKFGSYMLYRTNGRFPVFIDNRFDMYGATFSDRYFVATGTGIGWVDIVKEYGINTAFVEADTGIARLLWASPDWKMIYHDKRAIIFVRKETS